MVLVLAACACRSAEQEARPHSLVPEPNVIVIVIDTLRADRLPFHGGPAHTAPFLASLAEHGLVFDNAWAASSWTAPSTASLFTGQYPNQHGVEYNAFSQLRQRQALGVFLHNRLPEEIESLPRLMQRLGYRTYGVSDNPNVDWRLGFDRGFDRFAGRSELGGSGADKVGDVVLGWRDELLVGQKYFLYLHFADPHTPYHRHPEWIDAGAPVPEDHALDLAAYDSEIRYVDEQIRKLFAALEVDRRSLVFVTSDHGQEFLDHGGRGHGFQLYSELTRVPLLIHQPGNPGLVGRVQTNVAHVDLLPTLRELLGQPAAESDAGRSLLTAQRGDDARPAFSMRAGIIGSKVMRLRAVVRGPYKLIELEPAGFSELYDLSADPAERRDLSAQRPELVAELRALLAQQRARESVREAASVRLPAPSEELLRELDVLGYGEGGLNEGVPADRPQ